MSGSFLFAAEASESGFGPLEFAFAGSLLFWAFVCFLIYYFLLAPRLISRSEEIINDRKGAISEDLKAAEKANSKAAELLAQYEDKLDKARAEASSTVRDQIADAESKAIAAENRVAKKIIKQAAEADDRIREALSSAEAELRDSAAVTAQAAVERLAGLKVTKTTAKSAVKASAS